MLNHSEISEFNQNGFLVKKMITTQSHLDEMRDVAINHFDNLVEPIEYEADLNYPGAPDSKKAAGGTTTRRLLQAYARHNSFQRWAKNSILAQNLRSLFSSKNEILLSQCHHNCVMTKAQSYSSATLWHQDNRYWSFDEENLISVWLALGDESKSNGCLYVIPGSHRLVVNSDRFDDYLFLKSNDLENKQLFNRAKAIELKKGEVLFFHSKLFHAAGRNNTSETKLSVVFTYHESGNNPIIGSRSAKQSSIPISRTSESN